MIKKKSILIYPPLTFLLMISLAMLFEANQYYTQYKKSVVASGWPTVQGKVLDWKLVSAKSGTVSPKLKYSFVVDTKEYVSKSYSPCLTDFRERPLGDRNVKEGDTMLVFYNPNNPRESYINTSSNRAKKLLKNRLIALCISLFLFTIIIFLTIYTGYFRES